MKVCLIIIFVCCVFVVFATFFDFWTAYEAVKARKEKLSSHPMRKTGQKIIDYLRLVLYVLMIDVLGLMVFLFTVFHFCCITDIGYSIKGGLEHERELRTQTKQCS